jgi:hypothetical protein
MIAGKWMYQNNEQELTDNDTKYLASYAGDDSVEGHNGSAEKVDRMGHSWRLEVIETALTCDEQKREVTAEDELLSRH